MNDPLSNLHDLATQIRSGSIYDELHKKLSQYQKNKTKKTIKSIDSIIEKIQKKEKQMAKLLDETIVLQNELSKLLDKELKFSNGKEES